MGDEQIPNPDPDDLDYAGIVCGAAASFVLMFVGFGLGAAGHGWVSAFYVSSTSLLLYPSAGALFRARPSAVRQVWASVAVLSFIAADVALYRMTAQEGVQYFHKVSSASPLAVWLWFAIWAGGHAATVVGVYRQFKPNAAVSHDDP